MLQRAHLRVSSEEANIKNKVCTALAAIGHSAGVAAASAGSTAAALSHAIQLVLQRYCTSLPSS
jgi:hypothetical protein